MEYFKIEEFWINFKFSRSYLQHEIIFILSSQFIHVDNGL